MNTLYLSEDLYNQIMRKDYADRFERDGSFYVYRDYRGKKNKYIISNMEDYRLCEKADTYMGMIHITFVGRELFDSLKMGMQDFLNKKIEVDVVDVSCSIEDIMRYEISSASNSGNGKYVRSIEFSVDDAFPVLMSVWRYMLIREMTEENEMYDIIKENEWDFGSIVSNIMLKYDMEKLLRSCQGKNMTDISRECEMALSNVGLNDIFRNIYPLAFRGKVYSKGYDPAYELEDGYIKALEYSLKEMGKKIDNECESRKGPDLRDVIVNEIAKKILKIIGTEFYRPEESLKRLRLALERYAEERFIYDEPDENEYSNCRRIIESMDFTDINPATGFGNRERKSVESDLIERFKKSYISDRWDTSGARVVLINTGDKWEKIKLEEEAVF